MLKRILKHLRSKFFAQRSMKNGNEIYKTNYEKEKMTKIHSFQELVSQNLS